MIRNVIDSAYAAGAKVGLRGQAHSFIAVKHRIAAAEHAS